MAQEGLLSKAEKNVLKRGESIINMKLQNLTSAQNSSTATLKRLNNIRHDVPAILRYKNSTDAIECIDTIYDEENKKLKKTIPLLSDNLNNWVKLN